MFLGKNGLVEAEPTPKGWYITYIDRSPETLAREAVRLSNSINHNKASLLVNLF